MAEMDAQIGLTADATGVEAGVGRAKKSLASLGASAAKMGQDVAGAGEKAGKAIGNLGDGGEKSAKKIERDTKSMQSSIQRYLATLEAGSKDSRKYWETMADFKGVDKNALRPLLDQLDLVASKTRETESAASLLGGAFTALRAAAGVAIGSAVVQSASQAATALYEASVQAERLRIMLDFSSARGSVREISYLRTITSDLGLAFGTTATAYSQFQAAARGTALEGEKSRAVFESIAKASAVMGLSAEQSSGVLLALQQMISKGTVQTEELRGQLGEQLPGAFHIAARAMGVTTAELGKMLEQGQVIADDFLPKFAKALNESLGGAAENAANRLDAATNRLNNAWDRLKQNVGDSGVSTAMADGFGTAAGSLDALSVSIERARISGSGFFGQLGSSVVTMYELGSITDRAKVNMYDNAKATAEAQKELERLQRIAATEGTSAWVLKEIGNLSRYIGELQRAKRERMALDGPEKDPRDQSGFKPRGASYSDYSRQQAESEKALIDVRTRSAGINKQYFADLKTYEDALRVGTISTGDYIKAVSELATTTWKSSTAGKDAEKSLKDGASEAKKAASEYQRLVDSIKTKIATEEKELAGGEKLTESQRLRVQFAQELQTSLKGLSAAKVSEYTADLDRLEVLERESTARKEFLEIAEQERQQRIKIAQAAEQSVASLITGNQQLRDEIQLIGLSAAEQMEVIRLREETVLLVNEQHLAEMARAEDMTGTMTRERIALEQEIELRRERLELMGQKVKQESVVEANKEVAREWQRTADEINRSLTDALMRGFEDGKGFAANLRDTVVNMFKTMVLRPIVSAIVMPVAGALTGALGLAGSASAGQGGVLSTVGNIGSGYSLLSGLGGAFGGGLSGGFGGLMGSLGLSATGTTLAGALDAGMIALQAGNIAGGLGTLAGALGPIALGLAGLVSVFGGMDRSGTPHWGAAAEYDGTTITGGSDVFRRSGTAGTYSAQAQAGVDAVAKGVGDTLNGLARAFGRDGGYSVMTAYSDDSSEDPGFGSLRITRDGQKIRDWEDDRTSKWAPGIFADGEEGWKLYLSAIAKDTRQALQDMDIPGWADKMLSDLGDTVTMEQLAAVVQQIGVINTAFEQLGHNMAMFSGITDELQGALLEAAGGIDTLVNSAGAFYQGFYSEAERMDALRGQLNTALSDLDLSIDPNLGDDAKAQFRAAVENAMASGNAELAASLLAISGNFASAADYFEQLSKTAADAARKAAEDAQRSALDMFKRAADRDRQDLQAQASSLSEAISGISSAVDLLKSNARDLYGEVDSTAQMAAARGMVYVENALAGVRAGASVADYTGLSDAISAARGGLGSGAYQSEFERQRDTLVLAGQLSELGELGDMQLSVEERQLRAINDQLEYLDGLTARADELINGTVTLTGTVESYFQQLIALFDKGDGGDKKGSDGGSGGGSKFAIGGSGPGEGGGGGGGAGETQEEEIRRYYRETDISDPQSMRNARNTALFMGWTQEDIAKAYDVDPADLRKLFDDFGIPSFDVGINRVPHDMVARIHKDEAILPAAYNPFNPGAQRFGGGDSALVEELRALRKEVAELRLISSVTASNTAQLPVMADQFDSVTEGGNAMRGDAGNVLEL